jgi:hypothetical protein
MSSCVMKLAVRSGRACFGSVVGKSLPTIDSDRVWPRRVSVQHVEYLAMTSAVLPWLK